MIVVYNMCKIRSNPSRARPGTRAFWWPACAALAAALLLPARPAAALDPQRAMTQYLHRIWQMQQGLPEGTIYSISQTPDGFLWLGTQTGLVRFDGVQFTTIRDAQGASLEHLWIRDVLPDATGGLWLATDGVGLIYLKDGVARTYTTKDGLPSDRLRALTLGRDGTLWVAADAGLAALREGRVTRDGVAEGLALRNARDVCEDKDGRIWIAGDGTSLAVWDGRAFRNVPIHALPPNASIEALACSENAVWAATTHGIVWTDGQSERRFTTADGLPSDLVTCVVVGPNGCIYGGTNSGFFRIRSGEVETFGTAQGLSQSTVLSLFHDREGSLWIGTKHGLNQLMDRRTIPFTTSEGLASNNSGPVLEDDAGIIWVGTLDAGLNRFDGKRFSVIDERQGLTSNTVLALADDGSGGLWVGTSRGLDHLRGGKIDGVYTAAQGLPSDAVLCLRLDSRGALWAGTRDGLAVLGGNGRFTQPVAAGDALRSAVLALGEHQGRIVAATDAGELYATSDGRLEPLLKGSVQQNVDAFYEDPDGLLWIGSRGGGLRVLDGSKTLAYTIRDGLYDDDIYGITGDHMGKLWVACSKGIFSVARADLKAFAAGGIKQVKCMPFSPLEALRTIECKPGVQPAAWQTRGSEAWFSTIRGVLAIDTDRIMRPLPVVPVVIDEVVVNGRAVPPGRVSALPPGDANLQFRYTALSFLVPARITFRYQLEGFDKDWVDAGTRREAFYTNLPPGHYRFRVMAQNVENTSSEAASPVVFAIYPYIWQRRWFAPLCAALILWAAWMVYRQRVSRIRQRLDVVLTERSRIARELHDTLMQGFSGITMEMQALSGRLPEGAERNELNDIIGDAGLCLRDARRSIAGLRTPQDDSSGLAASIEQHARQLTEAKDVRLKLKLDGNPHGLPPAAEYNLLRIAQEAVANSVKHAAARTIEVSLSSTAQEVRLCVKDDGAGLKDGNGNGRPGHYGLIGMRERAAQIGADIRIDSEAGRGTSVCVLLPTGHHHARESDGNGL